ncbi:phosphoglucomutase-2 [Scaptodrosophila lebanonensis]|uniref:Phosphoglucomutase-2 n=1 Tax=Drosophila lebanonensis TaxID=7225 RepID=A0A6J2UEW5_DROLE|nr:phosphoglucomutase-2 [Scaptodrosophila lebanonensis]
MAASKPATPLDLIKTLELSGEEDLDEQIKNWIIWDRNEASINQVVEVVKEQDWQALRLRLCHQIHFEPSGLLGIMRAGFDSVNDLIIIQTAQGLSKFLIDAYPSLQKRETQGVVIGYDGRYNSKRFAQLVATVFLNENFRVYLFQRVVPTPFVPFTVIRKKCLAGIVVTGSRFPKEVNGICVYWTNGALVIPPIDRNINNAIQENLEPRPTSWDLSVLDQNPILEDPYREIYPGYYDTLKKSISPAHLETNECSQLRFVYTAMHGVGYPFVKEAFYQARLKPVIAVLQQRDPDPEFPTLVHPDPEEGRVALEMSIKKAEEEHCTIILATDPDATSLAVAELDPKGRWKIFNGNEIGALLGWWTLECYKTRTQKPDLANCVMISNIVSSRILAAMAREEGFIFVETLRGFKWMGNKAFELLTLGKNVLFAFEESLGYMIFSNLMDRDGVSAACHIATMACHLRTTRNITLIEKLREIYDRYGYHASVCSYLISDDPSTVEKVFEHLRSFDGAPGTYPKSVLGGEFQVMNVRDMTTGVDTTYADNRARLPVNINHEMITFTFTSGFSITLRGVPDENKLKYFAEICGLPEEKDWGELSDKLYRMVDAVIDEFLQPKIYGLRTNMSNE